MHPTLVAIDPSEAFGSGDTQSRRAALLLAATIPMGLAAGDMTAWAER